MPEILNIVNYLPPQQCVSKLPDQMHLYSYLHPTGFVQNNRCCAQGLSTCNQCISENVNVLFSYMYMH